MKTTPTYCGLYGCNRSKNPVDLAVTTVVDDQMITFIPCNFHYEMLEVMDPSLYSFGFTYRGDLEMRLHPVTPVVPAE